MGGLLVVAVLSPYHATGYRFFTECGEVDGILVLVTEKPMIQPPTLPAGLPSFPSHTTAAGDPGALRKTAEAFEAVFLSEMLKAGGFGQPQQGLGSGGAGEDTFASYFADIHARAMVARGGIGLADRIEAALTSRTARDTP
jgi:peptidoglycan hydrolase FlgJ